MSERRVKAFEYLNKPYFPAYVKTILVSCFILVSLSTNVYTYYKNVTKPARTTLRDMRAGTHWVNENTLPDAIVLAQYPESVYLYTNRYTINFPNIENEEQFVQFIKQYSVGYVLIAPKLHFSDQLVDDDYLTNLILPILNSRPDCFKTEYLNIPEHISVWSVFSSCSITSH